MVMRKVRVMVGWVGLGLVRLVVMWYIRQIQIHFVGLVL